MNRIEVYVSRRLKDFVEQTPDPQAKQHALVYVLTPIYQALEGTGPVRLAKPRNGDYEFSILAEDEINKCIESINKLPEYSAKGFVEHEASFSPNTDK